MRHNHELDYLVDSNILPFVHGINITKKGYVRVFDKRVGKHKMLHNLVYEHYKGEIPENYQIHHIDENKLNNDISNLVALSPLEHKRVHSGCFQKDGIWYKPCTHCGEIKPFSEYYRIGGGKWLGTWCKSCIKENATINKRKRKGEKHRGR